MKITTEQIEAVLAGEVFSGTSFLHGGLAHGEVHALAARLFRDLQEEEPAGPVCLAAVQKPLMAASLLASLAGGPPLLLPYATTRRALDQLRRAVPFARMITDDPGLALPGVSTLPVTVCQEKAPLPPTGCDPHRELLRIFTGGTTGSPQLWTKTGTNLFGEALFLCRHYKITADDRILATVPSHHIYGLLFSVLLPLVSGASVIDQTPSFPAEIADTVRTCRPTILVAVPAHYRGLMHQPLPGDSLRLAFSSAGMLGERENSAFSSHNHLGITEVFGSTETGGIGERNRFGQQEHFTAFPIVDHKVHHGRLAVRSPFISPDLPVDEEGFFLTADRAEPCPDNGFIFTGRSDNITKVGGKRVDLDEIRTLILRQPEVSDCLLVALPEEGGRGHRIGGLVQGRDIVTSVLCRRLRDTLSPHAVPKILKIVDRIPVRQNGKYDRQAAIALLSPCS